MSASIDSLAHSFTYSSSGKSFKSAVPARQPHQNDFITFLEVARQLGLDFVHISWQPGLENAGHGATTTIRQALVDLQLSFVFKRVEISSSGNSGTDERRIFGALISEIQVLSSMRDHPNIVRLYGVYLHVDSATEKVWPVLLLEKAPHGDLRSFINYGKGQSLDLEYRLKLCWDIATAVNDMHTKGT